VVRSTRVLDAKFGFLRGAAAQIRHSGVMYSLYLWCATTLADWLCGLSGVGAVPTRSVPGLRVLNTRNVNDSEAQRFLGKCSPDLLVSAYFNQRLHAAALALPKHGCLNIHPSLLPAAKGVDPVFQSLLRGAPPLGVTVTAAIESVAGGATGSPQSGAGNYQSWPTRREVSALRARGGALLRLGDLYRLARGQLPRAEGEGRERESPASSEGGRQPV
jgi:hypothetical protein